VGKKGEGPCGGWFALKVFLQTSLVRLGALLESTQKKLLAKLCVGHSATAKGFSLFWDPSFEPCKSNIFSHTFPIFPRISLLKYYLLGGGRRTGEEDGRQCSVLKHLQGRDPAATKRLLPLLRRSTTAALRRASFTAACRAAQRNCDSRERSQSSSLESPSQSGAGTTMSVLRPLALKASSLTTWTN